MTSLHATESQSVSFVELFFDLVFVFAVTQVTALLAQDLTGGGVVKALIVFWLIWWAWTQFTWSLNEADTGAVVVRLLTLVATALAFLMAVTVPTLVGPWGWLFSISYLAVRALGIGLQWRVSAGDEVRRYAVKTWLLGSSFGLGVVAAAALVPPDWRYPVLGVAALLDVWAALRAGRGEWGIYAGHFAERHGLFMIIVLGESLIAAGLTATQRPLSFGLVAVTVLAVAGTCALWWTYFGWAKAALESGLEAQPSAGVGRFARDVYSFGHFPIIFGVIGFAVAIEESVAHATDPLSLQGSVALAVGVALILGATALTLRLAGARVPAIRWWATLTLVASVPFIRLVPAWVALAVVATVTVVVAVAEPDAGRVEAPTEP
ncbi:MAG TPA: low temperature requirement protein A [Acidimicrobiia bacterium]